MPKDESKQARKYGEYSCDLPIDTLHLMGDYIKENLEVDAILWTGDIAPHDRWNYNLEYIKDYSKLFADYIKANLSEYSIYLLEGNHDFGVASS